VLQSPKTYMFVLPWPIHLVGGVNQVVINLAREFEHTNRFRPLIFISDWSAKSPIFEEVLGLNVVRWRVYPWKPWRNAKEAIAHWLWRRHFRKEFRAFCTKQNVAVVNPHFPDATALTLFHLLLQDVQRPTILASFHGADIAAIRNDAPAIQIQWRWILERMNGAVACSNSLRDELRAVLGDDFKVMTIHNGLDVETFLATDQGTPEYGRYILNIGKFEHKKGQDVLIAAFAEIAAEYTDLNLVLVGAADRELEPLKAKCRSAGIDDRVHFHINVPHHKIAAFVRNATIFCLPSRKEPFGIVVLEAGACAVPVVASSVGGITEILTNGEHGILCPPDDVDALARSLRVALNDPIGCREMAERLRQLVTTRFTWSAASESYLKLASR
jgi:glycosyltransferase involved in cell wall biosynthesis